MTPSSHLGFVAIPFATALGTAAAIASGCTVLTNDAPLDDAGVFEASAASTAPPPCATCIASDCTATAALCFASPECVALHTCAREGNCDAICSTAEQPTADAGASAALLDRVLVACRSTSDCASRCGDAGPVSPCDRGDAGDGDAEAADASARVPDPSSCAPCTRAKCGDATKACAASSECSAFLACAFACETRSCIDDCAKLHATGKAAAGELASCSRASCETECGLLVR